MSAKRSLSHRRALNWLAALSSAVAIVFCSFMIVNFLSMSYYPLVHRYTVKQTLIITLISSETDALLTRCAVAVSFVLLAYVFLLSDDRFESTIILIGAIAAILTPSSYVAFLASVYIPLVLALTYRARLIYRLFTSVLIIFLPIELLSLIYWLSYPFLRLEAISRIAYVQSELFYAIGKANVILVMMLLFSWAIAIFASKIKGMSFTKSGIAFKITSIKVKKVTNELHISTKRMRALALLLTVSLSCIIVVYPYLPSVNPGGRYVSVDAPAYESYITTAMRLNGVERLRYIFGNMSLRALPIWSMHAIQSATGASPESVVKFFPIMLSTFLTLSSYLLVSAATHDDERALYSAILSSTSFIVTVGMYAGYYANWLAISMAMLSLSFMFRFIEKGKLTYLVSACIFFILTNASHNWTWTLMSASLMLYLLYHIIFETFLRGRRLDKRKLMGVTLPVALSLMYDILRGDIVGVGLTRVGVGYIFASSGIMAINLFLIQRNLVYMLEALVGGLTSNAIYFGAAALGIITFRGEELSKFLVILLFATCFPFLFYDPIMQSRLLYALPIHLMAAAGVLRSVRIMRAEGLWLESKIFVVILILSSANYALRSTLNLI